MNFGGLHKRRGSADIANDLDRERATQMALIAGRLRVLFDDLPLQRQAPETPSLPARLETSAASRSAGSAVDDHHREQLEQQHHHHRGTDDDGGRRQDLAKAISGPRSWPSAA
jgi:hypothetical protein